MYPISLVHLVEARLAVFLRLLAEHVMSLDEIAEPPSQPPS